MNPKQIILMIVLGSLLLSLVGGSFTPFKQESPEAFAEDCKIQVHGTIYHMKTSKDLVCMAKGVPQVFQFDDNGNAVFKSLKDNQ